MSTRVKQKVSNGQPALGTALERDLRTMCHGKDPRTKDPRWQSSSPRHIRTQRRRAEGGTGSSVGMHVLCMTCCIVVACVLALGLSEAHEHEGKFTIRTWIRNLFARAFCPERTDNCKLPDMSQDSESELNNINKDISQKGKQLEEPSNKGIAEQTDKGLSCDKSCQNINSHIVTQVNVDSNISKVDYSDFDWVPSQPANIYDPVDDAGFPYNRLNHFKPRSQITDGLDIVAVELRKKTSYRGSHVRAFLLDDLLSERECDALRHVHDVHVAAFSTDPIICFDSIETLRQHLRHIGKNDVTVSRHDFTKDTRCVNTSMSAALREWGLHWSTGTGFYLGESAFSKVLDARIEKVTGLKSVNGGAFRIVSYLQNVGYKEHTDCSIPGLKGKEDRYATILIYLDDVQIGGHTYFPELGISVKPKKGRALVWNSMDKAGKCDPSSLHAAQPVTRGTKYILQRWYYYDNFPGVASRPPIPPIPTRLPTQGLVSCDEFLYGSCRLYDVWTYDIVTHW